MSIIKHLVLSGGGPLIFQTIGIMQHLEKKNIYTRTNLQSIYGTSSGAIVGLFICLGYDWDVINKFMIERPWNNLYYIDSERIYNAIFQCGVYDSDIFIKSYKSLFEAKDVSIDITLKEFYELTKIDYHLISSEINNIKIEDISHETYPDLKVIEAIYMTACLPVFFKPMFIDDKCFLDGGIIMNYPLQLCMNKYNNKDEILGLKHIQKDGGKNENQITQTIGIFEYIFKIVSKLIRNVCIDDKNEITGIKHEISCDEKCMTLELILSSLKHSETRRELVEKGITKASEYCDTLEDSN